jgi:arylsulfatase A-like enzyme
MLDRKREPYERQFPLGLPSTNFDDHFILEDGMDFIAGQVAAADAPFLGYFHFLPPHHPYHTRSDFFQRFHRDGIALPEKPHHVFTQGVDHAQLAEQSTWYDEFILYVDAEFGRLYASLEESGALENTWIVLTSDHGELFERGIRGHNTPTLFRPVIHVPLMIFPPGQMKREDVYVPTSSVDLLPTLLHVSGKGDRIADWMEGRLLPPFGRDGGAAVDVFAVEAQETKPNDPMRPGTLALHRDNLKLIYYFGYPELGETGELVELYDLETDPGETHDLYADDPALGAELLEAVKQKIAENDAPFAQSAG